MRFEDWTATRSSSTPIASATSLAMSTSMPTMAPLVSR